MNTKRIAAAFAAAALVVLGTASGASATFGPTPPPYEAPTIELTVTPTTLPGGESFSFEATSNQPCDWTVTYAGPSSTAPFTGSGTSITGSFVTDPVEDQQTDAVTASCGYDDGTRVSAPNSTTRSVDVTLTGGAIVDPPIDGGAGGSGGAGGLPNTGGPSYWLAALGAVLTAIGAGAVIRSRRPARA